MEKQIAIIGAGLAGLHAAYELEQRGFKNIHIYEAYEIGFGSSSKNTGKVTIQQGSLLQTLPPTKADTFIHAQEEALERLKTIIEENKLACEWKKCDSEIQSHATEKIMYECECYDQLELSYQQPSPAALTLKEQYSYHPRRFLQNFAKLLKHTQIHEHTPIHAIKRKEDDYTLTSHNQVFQARYLILCTNYPILYKPLSFFLTQIGQYVITTHSPLTKDTYTLQLDNPKLSFNQTNPTMRFTAYGERVGKDHHAKEMIKVFESSFSTSIDTIEYMQDVITSDGLPICGTFSSAYPNTFVVTGFNKWGNLNAVVCARVIGNLFSNIEEPINQLLSFARFSLYNQKFLAENYHTITALLNRQAKADYYINNTPYGSYTKEGQTYLVSLVCPHLKGILRFNPHTKHYECPVHGSLFNYDGSLLHAPAVSNLVTLAKPLPTSQHPNS